jgi:hypothetical protein
MIAWIDHTIPIMSGIGRISLGSLVGASLAAAAAPLIRPMFSPTTGGVGAVTIAGYPKGWDYAVIAILVLGAFVGGMWSPAQNRVEGTRRPSRRAQLVLALIVFVAMLFVHDHPFAHMDNFHEGEHLTPAYLFQSGERPFRDVFLLHGLGVDGGLDALVAGSPPRPLRTRRLQTVLDAATLALLVPIAAEVTATAWGLGAAVFASLCGVAALWLPVFPYFRLAPVLLAALGMLRYVRSGRAAPLFLAFASATLGVLWSLDTGTYALAGAAIAFVTVRVAKLERAPMTLVRVLMLAAIALVLPIIVLLLTRADLRLFFRDSFVIIPSAIDAVWSLPAPKPFTAAGVRYYLPPAFYGFLLALAVKRRDPRIAIVAILSIVLFRTAAGRVSWSHTRFAAPMLGIAFVAFVLEPLKNRIAMVLLAIAAIFYVEISQNVAAGAKLASGWRARQKHEGLVRHPLARGIYTSEQNATELATLRGYLDSLGPGTILDFSNERALYVLLERMPPARCFDVPMLSAPALLRETMAELHGHPPMAVILGGSPEIAIFDGVPLRDRVPELATWIDVNYPKRTEIGRFTVATR